MAARVAVLLRLANAVALAPLGLWIAWLLYHSNRQRLATALVGFIVWSVPVGMALGITAIYDHGRFGNMLNTGYGQTSFDFPVPLNVGLYGLTLSPGKDI